MTWINEIFCSLQGEGRFSGIPTTFVRFAGCDVRCDGCDTQYAWSPKSGKSMTIEQIMDEIAISEAERVCLSVDEDEPIVIKHNSEIKTIPIKDAVKYDNFEALTYNNGEAVFKPVTGIWSHEVDKQYKVKTKPMSMEVTMTGSHSIMVVTPNGIKSKLVEELNEGDFLLAPKNINVVTKDSIGVKEAKYFGWLVAEGNPSEYGYRVATATKKDSEKVLELHKEVTGNTGSIQHSTLKEQKERFRNADYIEPTTDYYWCDLSGGKEYSRSITDKIGKGARNKKVPSEIFSATDEAKIAFIKACSNGDGRTRHDEKRSTHWINVTTSSKILANGIMTLAQTMGINGRFESFKSYSPKDSRYLGIQYKVIFPYNDDELGRRRHETRVTGIPKEIVNIEVNRDDPHATKRVKRQDYNLSFLEDWNVLEVSEIKEVEERRTVYDLEVPGTNTFTAGLGNILCHNTGGEPLIQKGAVKKIVEKSPYPVSIETSGMYKFNDVDCPCTIDIKPPSMVRDYTMEHHFNARPMDEFKLVVGTEEDKMFARAAIDSLRDFGLNNTVWISPLWGTNEEELAEWFVENNDKLKGDVRMQLQIHKYIWDPNKRGV